MQAQESKPDGIVIFRSVFLAKPTISVSSVDQRGEAQPLFASRGTTLPVPIGSMLIFKAMNTNSLTLNRFRSEVESHFGLALALRAASKQTVSPYVPISYQRV